MILQERCQRPSNIKKFHTVVISADKEIVQRVTKFVSSFIFRCIFFPNEIKYKNVIQNSSDNLSKLRHSLFFPFKILFNSMNISLMCVE